MAQQISYDEKGSTFLYFLLSFFAMILIPLTYLMWPKTLKEEERQVWSQRDIHGKSKWYKKKQEELRRKKSKPSIRKILLVLAWIGFLWLVYKVSTIENDHIEYNPYEVLGVSEDAGKSELKKVYYQLSKENHPDKGGDPEKFMRIRKAYEALTDEETMQNWREYGNPDGPQAMEFGIALPKWIVETQNSFVVLSIYMFLFMIALPLVVGIWWNRSIKYTKEQVLLDTTQLFYHYINKTPTMNLKRALMIFSGSFEFSHDHNTEVRPPSREDNEDIPDLISELEHDFNIVENAKDRPFNFPYSVKSRVLIYSHLCRLDINSAIIQKDVDYVLRKSPLLIQEMVNCIAQLTTMAHWNKANLPRLETLENVMKLAPMMVQGLRDNKSSLLQLPYFNDEFVKFCYQHKRQSVRGLRSLVELRESDRRQMLRRMGDEEYDTMLSVLRSFPLVDLDVTTQVIDDEEAHVITAGAIVTVTVSMKRRCLGDLQELDASPEVEVVDEEEQELQEKQPKLKAWQKQGKKKKVMKKKKPAKGAKKPVKKLEKKAEETNGPVTEVPMKNKEEADTSGSDSERSDSDSEPEHNDEKDDREWQAMQSSYRRKEKVALEVKDKKTHTVYAPYMPVEKQEWWWLYVCDRKKHLLLTSPVLVTNLREEEETELKFPAPTKPGRYTYTVWLRSDSYFECDQKFDLKLDVKEAKPVIEDHPQWNISGDEGDGNADESEDEGISSEEQSSSEE